MRFARTGPRTLSRVAALALLVPLAAAAADFDLRLEVGGRERTYLLHVPPAPDGAPVAEPRPLLLAFHGGGGRASGYRDYSGLDAVADREGFVVAYPDGTGRLGRRLLTWNAGRCCGFAEREDVDDVAFARALVDDVAERVAIDRTRVYATGHSNGAMMSYRLAVEAPDLVAAVAPVAAAMIVERFDAKRPVPVLHVQSVDDPRAPWKGGLGPPFPLTNNRVRHNAAEEELARWIALNGCPAEPVVLEERKEASTGHGATHYRFAPCTSRATVELWKLTGAGHGWPGGGSAAPERVIGPHTGVISASDEVWKFVSRFRLAPSSAASR